MKSNKRGSAMANRYRSEKQSNTIRGVRNTDLGIVEKSSETTCRGGEGVRATAATFLLRPEAGDVHIVASPPSCLLLRPWRWLCKLFSGACGGG
jgi:hypothetical protein